MTRDQFLEEMYAFADLCFAMAEDMSWSALAAEAGVSDTTLRNLFTRKTCYPRFQTMQRLGVAVGLRLEFTEAGKPTVRMTKRRQAA